MDSLYKFVEVAQLYTRAIALKHTGGGRIEATLDSGHKLVLNKDDGLRRENGHVGLVGVTATFDDRRSHVKLKGRRVDTSYALGAGNVLAVETTDHLLYVATKDFNN